MMKKFILIPLIIVLASGLILTGCGSSAPSPAPAPATTLTPTPTPKTVEPIKLKFAHPSPPMTVFHQAIFAPWAEMIKERTTAIGKPVEIKIFPAGSLAKHEDLYKAVTTGIADIGGMIINEDYVGGGGLLSVMELPLLYPSSAVAAQIAQELHDTMPELQKETSGVKLLWFHPTAPGHIHSRTKQIKTLEDLRGQKVWSKGGRLCNNVIESLEAVPVGMPITEGYVALERGVMDMAFAPWEAVFGFKWFEVAKYRTSLPRGLWLDLLSVAMNRDSFNRLPPDVQEIFEELSGSYMSKLSGEAFDEACIHFREVILQSDKDVGNPEIYNLPEDEFQRWTEAVAPVHENWITDMEARGLPGRVVYENAVRLLAKYSK